MKNMNQIMWVKDPVKEMLKPFGRHKVCVCYKAALKCTDTFTCNGFHCGTFST